MTAKPAAQYSALDHEMMAVALQLARRGIYSADPNPCVGAVVVAQERIVGAGWHRKAGEPHAEVHALREAGELARGATAYVSLEPCSHTGKTPPCANALIEAGVARVVVAIQDPNPLVAGAGIERLRKAGIAVQVGLLQAQARELNCGFISRMERGRPYVRVKLACSLDGRTAMRSGESKWISSAESRVDVHRFRARSSAILTGIGTIRSDDPSLNVRLNPEQIEDGFAFFERHPVRLVVDSECSISLNAKLFSLPGSVWIACVNAPDHKVEQLRAKGAEVIRLESQTGRVPLTGLLQELGKRGINELMVEAGETLNGALVQENLVDEILLYMAPHLMGDQARNLFHLPGIVAMAERIALRFVDVRAVGSDVRMILKSAE